MQNTTKIKVYLVGGAVRDKVLGREAKDLDFVVVGATRGYMECMGFTQVGADFPVFLHPISNHEFALARTERKTSKGYHGFECDFTVGVTLEDDLIRRDLTMNSMAIEVNSNILETGIVEFIGDIIDPYNGQIDARRGILRHTSEAFSEDPLRVLRTARFAARYDFEIAISTIQLMQDIVASGEMDSLPMERVFAEFEKAVMEDHPGKFFDYLNKTDAFELYFEELLDWNSTEFQFGVSLNASFEERVGLLLMDTDYEDAKRLLERIKAPNILMDTVLWSCHMTNIIDDTSPPFFDVENLDEQLWAALDKVNAWRSIDKLQHAAQFHLYEAEHEIQNSIQRILAAACAGRDIGFDDLDTKTRGILVGKEIGKAISLKRLEVIKELNLYHS